MSRELQKDNLFKSLVTSLAVCIPSFCLSVYIMEAHITWPVPTIVMGVILGMAMANFGLIVALEYWRSKIGRLTLPALVTTVGVVLLYVMAESINRFFEDFGFNWLLPVVMIGLAMSTVAIFRERMLLLKFHLALNSVMLAVLWGLGVSDKVALPF